MSEPITASREESPSGAVRVCLAVVVAAHGVRGEVRLRCFTAAPEDVAAYGPLTDASGTREFRLRVTGAAKGGVRACIAGIDDRDAADALRGTELYVAREALPPPEDDEFYHADLIGLAAETPDGSPLGRVVAVQDYGGGDIVEIAAPDGDSLLVPFTRDAVPEVNLAAGRIVVCPPPADEAPA